MASDGPAAASEEGPSERRQDSFWEAIHVLEAAFHASLEKHDSKTTISSLLELDRAIWQARQEGESEEFISQAREILREMLVLLGMELEAGPKDQTVYLTPLVAELVDLRERFRQGRKWQEADAVRESLLRVNVVVEDTKDGPRWHFDS